MIEDHHAILIITIVNCFLVAASVLIHYEMLGLLSKMMNAQKKLRRSMVFLVLGSLTAHVVEVWLYGVAFYVLQKFKSLGYLAGNFDGSLLDCVFFSIVTFTSTGYGDIEVHGMLRFVAGFEALTGLVLLAWTISFIFKENQPSNS